MTKEQLEAQADELQKQLNALSEKIANCKDEPKMFPEKGEYYWYYDSCGVVRASTASDSKGRLNASRTEEEAKKAAGIQWAKQRVAHRIAVLNDGWVPDWKDSYTRKYIIRRINPTAFEADYYGTVKLQPIWMYCKTEEIAKQIIDECRDDLLLIFSE